MTIADQLKRVRAALGVSQKEMADLLEVSDRTVWAWEKGKAPSKIEQFGLRSMLPTLMPKKAAKGAK